MAGRPQGLKLDPALTAPVLQEPVQLCARDRLGIPLEIANAAPWMAERAGGDLLALAVLEAPGKIALRSWKADSPAVLDVRRQLVDALDHQAIRILEDKYRRVQIAKDARVTLTLSHILHLGLPPDSDAYVYVALVGEVIEILSTDFRNQQLARVTSMFGELP